jgi:hypothetical protein
MILDEAVGALAAALGGDIMLFAQVFREIIKSHGRIHRLLNRFPIADARGLTAAALIERPVEIFVRPLLCRLTDQRRYDREAVDILRYRSRRAGRLGKRRHDVLKAAGELRETPQDDQAATYAHRLTKDDGAIDWTRSAKRVHDLIRGLHPWPHAFTFHRGARFILLKSTPSSSAASDEPGTILEAAGDTLSVAAGVGSVEVRQIQAEGKRPMNMREFLAGHQLRRGDRFTAAP